MYTVCWMYIGYLVAGCSVRSFWYFLELFALYQKACTCQGCDFHFWWTVVVTWAEGWPIVGTWTDWHSTARSEEIVNCSVVPTACPNSCHLHSSPSSAARCATRLNYLGSFGKFRTYLHLFAQGHSLKVEKTASRKSLWFSVCAPPKCFAVAGSSQMI